VGNASITSGHEEVIARGSPKIFAGQQTRLDPNLRPAFAIEVKKVSCGIGSVHADCEDIIAFETPDIVDIAGTSGECFLGPGTGSVGVDTMMASVRNKDVLTIETPDAVQVAGLADHQIPIATSVAPESVSFPCLNEEIVESRSVHGFLM